MGVMKSAMMADKRGNRHVKTQVDVSGAIEAFTEFEKKFVNARNLKGAVQEVNKRVVNPALVHQYATGPRVITGALSKNSATKSKAIYFKNTKNAVAIGGLRTNNVSIHTVDPKKLRGISMWAADQVAKGHKGKYRVGRDGRGLTVDNPLDGDTTLAGNRPWAINNAIQYSTKVVRGKQKRILSVRRDPSRIAHLIEFGHRFPRGGSAKSFLSVKKAHDKTRSAATEMLIQSLTVRVRNAAIKARQKGKT